MRTLESWAERVWYGLWLTIDQIIYWVTSLVYQVFYMITEVNLFDYDGAIGKLTERIYVVFGVVMLFVFAYNILLLLADPDKLNGKDNALSSIAKNTVISLVLVALLPTIFEYTYAIQYRVLSTNLIGNIVLGGTSISNSNETDTRAVLKSAGSKVATTIFSAFYHPLTEDGSDVSPSDCVDTGYTASPLCQDYIYAMNTATVTGDISKFVRNSTLEEGLIDGKMKYMYLISSLCGAAAVYLFASFALDVGLRAVKLAVLQVVAPIPIMLRITKPTGGIFSKWFKEIKETYISLFVRLAIIYFAIFSIDLLIDSYTSGSLFKEYGVGVTSFFAEVVLILSILAFAKEAPKLLKNLTGGAGGIEWNIRKKLGSDTYEYGRRAATALTTNALNTVKGGVDILSGRDPYGNSVGRLRSLARHLYNAPAATIHGFRKGWQNGGRVDFNQGIVKGFKDIGNEAVSAVGQVQARIDKSHQYREKGIFSIGGRNFVVPFISHAKGGIDRAFEVINQRNYGNGEGSFIDRMAIRMNRNLGRESARIAQEMSSAIGNFEKRYERGVSEIESNYKAEMNAYELHYHEQEFAADDRANTFRLEKQRNIVSEFSTPESQNMYNLYSSARSNYLKEQSRIQSLNIPIDQKTNMFTELTAKYNKTVSDLGIESGELTKMDAFFARYDQKILDCEFEKEHIEDLLKSKRASINAESKKAQFDKRAENMLKPEFSDGRIEWCRDAYDFFRQRSNQLSAEQLNKLFSASFKFDSKTGTGIVVNNFDTVVDAIKNGEYTKRVLDENGKVVSQTVKLDGEFLLCFDNLKKNLGVLSENNDSGFNNRTSKEKKEDKK